MRAHRRLHDLVHRAPVHLGGHHRRRRIGAHAAGVRPVVAVADALVVLRRGERDRGLAVAQREERSFLADKAIPRSRLPPASPSPPPNIMSIAASASCDGLRHHHAFAGREPVRLDHDRRALLAHVVFGGGRRRLKRS